MLLPNLNNNPEFQGKNLLSLEISEELQQLLQQQEEKDEGNKLLSLAYRGQGGQAKNWMYARSWFIPKSYRNRSNQPEDYWDNEEGEETALQENSMPVAVQDHQKFYEQVANDLGHYL